MYRRLPFLILVLAAFPAAAQLSTPPPDVKGALQQMELAAEGPISTAISRDTGAATFLSMSRPVPVTDAASTRPEDLALAFLRSYGRAFGFRDAAAEVTLKSPSEPSQRDELGMDHVRFLQVVRGVPVTAGEVTVHLRGDGVTAVNAETLPGLQGFDVSPTLAPEVALEKVRTMLGGRLGQPDAEVSEPRLEILNRGLLEDRVHVTRLAWFVEARGPALREYLWIDAKNGHTLLRFSQLTTALNRQIYNGNSLSILPGTPMRSEGGPATGDADADAAYQFSGDTYNYYLTQHGRDSFDGVGGALISTVHHCPSALNCPYQNAFWNGDQMVYGNGFSVADDVDAHELTHAVTERTANLFYYMQSGALNESFSDMFGETVDLTNTGGTDSPAVRWKLGEDVPGSGAIRDMMNPGTFFDPAKVSDVNYYCGGGDSGGVHLNSGVPNHFYALLVDGGTYNGSIVTGLGLTKAGKIAYRALTQYLASGSGFADAANAFKQSCTDLLGTFGISVADCQEVADAIAAVEMASKPPCTAVAAPALCPAGQTPSNLFFDDMESGTSNTNWSVSSTAEHIWFVDTSYASSPIWHLWGYDYFDINDSRIQMTSSVAIPANARMQFNHSWDLEPPNFDGGVVEYSLNNGTTWNDAAGLFSAGAGYNGTIESGYGNPIAGRTAFIGNGFGYTATQLNLSSLSGQNARFRFRLGSDSQFDSWGWYIDDVRIYTCGTCSYSLGAAAAFVGAGGGSGTVNVSTSSSCTWSATGGAAWVTLSSGDGTGSGTAGFTAQPNPTSSPRSTTVTIAGQAFTIYQGGATDFYTMSPCRLVDTRNSNPLSSGVSRTFAAAGSCGIPTTAKAIAANVTVVNQTGSGNVRVYPGALALPTTSTINFQATGTRANNAVISLAPDGTGTIQGYAFVVGGGTAHVLVDVSGYYQ